MLIKNADIQCRFEFSLSGYSLWKLDENDDATKVIACAGELKQYFFSLYNFLFILNQGNQSLKVNSISIAKNK